MTSHISLRLRRIPLMVRRLSDRAPDFSHRRTAFYREYWRYAADSIGAQISEIGDGYFQLGRAGRFTLVQYHHVNTDTYLNKSLVDNKAIVNRMVRASGFRAPRGAEYSIDKIGVALEFLEQSGGSPCVIKPKAGSGGRGITTSIASESRLIHATLHASNTLTIPSLLIEEQVPGDSYRLLYLGGKLIHAVQRGKCTVVGNGRSTIARLVEDENQARLHDTPLRSIEPLSVDFEMKVTLSDQGLSLRTIPSDGAIVRVKNVSNQNQRRDQRDVTSLVHADYHLLAAKMLNELGVQLIGIDVMSVDLSLPPSASGAAILEVNIPPGLHYHELIEGADAFTPVGATILEYVLADRRAPPYTEAALRIAERPA